MTEDQDVLIKHVAAIVSAHVSNNSVSVNDVPTLISSVHGALVGLSSPPAPAPDEKPEPAVSIRASVKPDYIIDLFTGKKLKMLKRHLATHHQMTPADYRAYWNLPADYPMVAPNYAARRKELAHKIGLGRKAGREILDEIAEEPGVADVVPETPVEVAAEVEPEAPKRRGRKPKAKPAE